jgi:PAS domain S-box-containing protein
VNLTIFQKGLTLILVPLVFEMTFVLVLIQFQREQVEAEQGASRTKEVLAQTYEIHTTVSEARAGVQGYVITNDPKFAESFHGARSDMRRHFEELFRLIQDSPEQTARAGKLQLAVNTLFDWLAENEQLVRGGTREELATRIRLGRGYEHVVNFRREFATFLADEEHLDRERVAALESSRDRLSRLIVAGIAFSVISFLVLAFAFRRGIAWRFAALEKTAHRLSAGETPPPPLPGADEIARVDRALREMAAKLTRATDQFRDLYDNAPCGYHSVDPDGMIVTINQTELQWLGYEPGEVMGRMRFADMVSRSSSEVYQETFTRVKEHGAATDIEMELVRKDGATFPVLLNSSAVRDSAGGYLRSRTTLTDLTERKRAEAAIRLFADVAQNIPIGLLIYQLDGEGETPTLRIRSANRVASQLLGVSLEEAVGHAVVEVFPAIPADQLHRYTQVAQSGRADDLGEFRYGDARVAERWWAVQAFPLPDRSVGIAFQDVSDRKRATDEIRRLHAGLERRVTERTAELEAANRDLAQKNTENEMFVYSVSHDLRSPLVNLQGFSKELEKGCRGLAAVFDEQDVPPDVRGLGLSLLDGKMAKSVGFIQTAVLRLSGIIDALLRLSRVGRVEYRREAVDTARVVAQVVAAAQTTIAERGATVRVGELPVAWGDRTAIEQVFANLIGNALTYLDPTRPGVIEVGTLPGGGAGSLTYFVRDNGLGIAEGHRQKIFQAFQRAHPGVGTGEGLGLAIVARVAERHHGRVWVESHPGEGSTFFITLPASPGTAVL